jgi:hypothetical protein
MVSLRGLLSRIEMLINRGWKPLPPEPDEKVGMDSFYI